MKILVTGAAGFIGSKLSWLLAKRGDTVVGIDNINTYYDPNLKYARLKENGFNLPVDGLQSKAIPETGNDGSMVEYPEIPWGISFKSKKLPNLRFIRMDIADREALPQLFEKEKFDKVMNLAAQAGVTITSNTLFTQVPARFTV